MIYCFYDICKNFKSSYIEIVLYTTCPFSCYIAALSTCTLSKRLDSRHINENYKINAVKLKYSSVYVRSIRFVHRCYISFGVHVHFKALLSPSSFQITFYERRCLYAMTSIEISKLYNFMQEEAYTSYIRI